MPSRLPDHLTHLPDPFLDPEPAWAAGFARHRWRSPVRIGVAVGAVLLIAAVWVVPRLSADTEPLELVERYLAAIIDGDADTAIGIADPDTSQGGDQLLTSETVAEDWRVVSARQPANDGYRAQVFVTVEAAGQRTDGIFTVTRDPQDAAWRIDNPFVEVDVDVPVAVPAMTINGFPVPTGDHGSRTLTLFPGLYRFGSATPGLELTGPDTTTILPTGGRYDDARLGYAPGAVVTRTGRAAVQSAVESFLNDCASGADSAMEPGCPFGAEDWITDDGTDLGNLSDLSWTITTYPTVFPDIDSGFDATIAVLTGEPGVAELTGTGDVVDDARDPTGDRARFAISCPIPTRDLAADIDPDGTATIRMTGDGEATCF